MEQTSPIQRLLGPSLLGRLVYPTPFLVMDSRALAHAYQQLAMLLPGVHIHYAMKCNPDRRVLTVLKAAGSKFEIASYPELQELMTVGVNPRDVIFSNPVKMWQHVQAAAQAGVYRFAFDSVSEAAKLAAYAPGAAVLLRLKTVPANSIVPSEGKFGVGFAQAVRLMRHARKLGLRPYGIAFHVGTQMEDPSAWSDALAHTGYLMRALADEDIHLSMVDMGGGFPASYVGSARPFADFAAAIRSAAQTHLPYKTDLAIEPGRALVGDAGIMAATVIGVAQRGRTRWAHLDVGAFNGMMEALESLNTLRFPMIDSRRSTQQCLYSVTGPSCDSQDTILYDVPLSADLAINDRVYIYTAGAYTTSYASRFNGFDIPKVYML